MDLYTNAQMRNLESTSRMAQKANTDQPSNGSLPSSKVSQRILGAAFFGLLCNLYTQNAADRTIPPIMSMVQKIDLGAAQINYDSSAVYHTSVIVVSIFLGAGAAGFLARRKGLLAGILSNSPYILLAGYILFAAIAPQYFPSVSRLPFADDVGGDTSVQRQILLRLVLFLLASCLGGFAGQKLYAPEIDLDLAQAKVTIFGIRWAHYFWILPFVYLAFLASSFVIAYAGITVILADLSFAWHPSLWFNFSWNWGFPLGPFLVWLALWITGASFVRFYEVMQYRQKDFTGWKKAGRVLLYGIGAPTLSYTLAVLGADVARAMPKPIPGDWKIAVGIMAIIIAMSFIGSTIARIRAKRTPLQGGAPLPPL